MERRAVSSAMEIVGDGEAKKLVGYAAVFYRNGDPQTEYRFKIKTQSGRPREVVERIEKRAFDGVESDNDVVGLVNHDPNKILGRVGAGTMRLQVDDKGLRYEIDLPNTPEGLAIAESVRRGDISGSSFSFNTKSGGEKWAAADGGVELRTLTSVKVLDVGPVTFPAYKGTSVASRADGDSGDADRSYEAWQRTRREIEVRSRLVSLDSE